MRLIEADKLQLRISKKKSAVAQIRYAEGFNDAILKVKSMIHSAPTIDAQPVMHGKWIGNDCGECGAPANKYLNGKPCAPFCWNCGAKMDLEDIQ